jgi:hypothetical protein
VVVVVGRGWTKSGMPSGVVVNEIVVSSGGADEGKTGAATGGISGLSLMGRLGCLMGSTSRTGWAGRVVLGGAMGVRVMGGTTAIGFRTGAAGGGVDWMGGAGGGRVGAGGGGVGEGVGATAAGGGFGEGAMAGCDGAAGGSCGGRLEGVAGESGLSGPLDSPSETSRMVSMSSPTGGGTTPGATACLATFLLLRLRTRRAGPASSADESESASESSALLLSGLSGS